MAFSIHAATQKGGLCPGVVGTVLDWRKEIPYLWDDDAQDVVVLTFCGFDFATKLFRGLQL